MNYFILPGILKVNFEPDRLFSEVTKFTGITKEEMQGKCRKQEIVQARYLFATIMRKNTNYTLQYIGSLINRDHSNLIFYFKKMDWFLKNEKDLANKYQLILNNL
jgi:chromosomal replication initiation ATPase DnaA